MKQDSGQWINNVTYCGGKNDKCVSEMIVTVANISLPKPGVVRHDYTDAPLSPQVIINTYSSMHSSLAPSDLIG